MCIGSIPPLVWRIRDMVTIVCDIGKVIFTVTLCFRHDHQKRKGTASICDAVPFFAVFLKRNAQNSPLSFSSQDKCNQFLHIVEIIVVSVDAFPMVNHAVFLVSLQAIQQLFFTVPFHKLGKRIRLDFLQKPFAAISKLRFIFLLSSCYPCRIPHRCRAKSRCHFSFATSRMIFSHWGQKSASV